MHTYALLIAAMLPAASPGGLELEYTGRLVQQRRDGRGVPAEQFKAQAVIFGEGASAVGQVVMDESMSALPWFERFVTLESGAATFNASGNSTGVALGYVHEERKYVLPVWLPFFPDHERLQPDASWTKDGATFEVTGDVTIDGMECWDVQVTTGPGRRHRFQVRQDEPIVVAGAQTIFMGRGDRFELSYRVTATNLLTDESRAAWTNATTAIAGIQGVIDRTSQDRWRMASDKDVAAASRMVESMVAACAGSPLEGFANKIRADLETRSRRAANIAELAARFKGEKAPPFALVGSDGKAIPAGDWEDSVVVLHFWSYRDSPLEAPYGQIGYLDFLHSRWGGRGVKVYGVAIDSQLANPSTRGQGVRSIRRLIDFMKIDYPVTIDTGGLLKTFGDPTRLGESLPLWVVIDPNGNVAEYRTGYYSIDPQRGLLELDQMLQDLVLR